ncbi:MAG: hypothetical protein L0312_26710 [Acidobacteria bacterium]|nr:hypothetical protein [Acidobacteriota bacterium]
MTVFATVDIPRTRPHSYCERTKEILAALRTSEGMERIADRFGVTRQRVGQIALRSGIRRRMLRKAEADALLAPYLDSLGEPRSCLLCGVTPRHFVAAHFCGDCMHIFRKLRELYDRLKNVRTGNPSNRTQAVWIIRHYGFVPDDLKFICKPKEGV